MLIAQISDTHIKTPGRLAYGKVDTAAMLRRCVDAIRALKRQPDLIVLTGDLVDVGQPDEYALLMEILAPLRQRILAVPGNHDDRDNMRAAFAAGAFLPAEGFLHFVMDDESLPLRVIGLDTVIPRNSAGELCGERLAWLDGQLAARPERPTLILMHHPPFRTGIGHMDEIGLAGADAFAAIVVRHPQIELITCGHLHRSIRSMVGGRAAITCPSPAHTVELDLDEAAPGLFRMEPPGYLLHWWSGRSLVTHHAVIGDYDGPHPFFGEDGKLLL